jgi:hypothetical protein
MKRVSCNVYGPTVNDPDEDSAPSGALAADRWKPPLKARLIRFFSRRELSPFPEAAPQSNSRSSPGSHLHKITTSELHMRPLNPKFEYRNSKQSQNSNFPNSKLFVSVICISKIRAFFEFRASDFEFPPLDMTRQTVIVCLCFRMAVHAPFHGHFHPGFLGRLFTLPDVSMTALALHPGQHHMATMGEEDVIRLLVEPFPGDLLPFFLKLSDLFFVRMFGQGFFVAFHTGCHFWHARKGLFLKMGMAGGALDALFLMFLVVERDGLVRPETRPEVDEKEEGRNPDCQSNQEGFHLSIPSLKFSP